METILKKYDLTEGVVWKVMIKFAFPIFLGTLFQSLYTTADAIIIGQFSGKEALAAIESVYALTKLPINFFIGLASGATIIISQYYGAKKIKEVSNASHTAILFAFVGGLILASLGCILSPFFIRLIKVPEGIIHEAQLYVIIYFSGMAASMLYNVGSGILRALGNSKTPFYFLIISNILNIILDLLFVAVFHLGVVGAAIATVISQVLCAILIIMALVRTELPCKIYLKKVCFHRLHLVEIFKLGLPVGVQATLFPISNMTIQSSINTFGVNSITAWAICGKMDFLIWSISDAFSVSVSTFVAQNYGAKEYKRARKGVRVGLGMSLLSISIVSCILYIWNVPLARLLVRDGNVILIASQIIHFLAPLYILFVFCDTLPAAIRGTGDTFKPMIVTLLGTCALRVLWILFVVPLKPTLITVLSCYPVSWGITAVMFGIFYMYKFSRLKFY